jgi:hypothetical protein
MDFNGIPLQAGWDGSIIRDFRNQAIEQTGTGKMAGFVAK